MNPEQGDKPLPGDIDAGSLRFFFNGTMYLHCRDTVEKIAEQSRYEDSVTPFLQDYVPSMLVEYAKLIPSWEQVEYVEATNKDGETVTLMPDSDTFRKEVI